MITFRVKFERLWDAAIPDYLGAYGVYVVWDARAIARPTYIGEGNILRRLTDHVERVGRTFAHPWDGYVGVVRSSKSGAHKRAALALECLLLEVAKETDRAPRTNQRGGTLASLLRELACETVRFAISGLDPLLPPSQSRALTAPKQIKAKYMPSGEIKTVHDWRRRKVRKPIMY